MHVIGCWFRSRFDDRRGNYRPNHTVVRTGKHRDITNRRTPRIHRCGNERGSLLLQPLEHLRQVNSRICGPTAQTSRPKDHSTRLIDHRVIGLTSIVEHNHRQRHPPQSGRLKNQRHRHNVSFVAHNNHRRHIRLQRRSRRINICNVVIVESGQDGTHRRHGL